VVSTVDTVVLPRRVGGLDIVERVPASRLRWACAAAALALGLLLALPLDGWADVDALLTLRGLGELEPYTGRDLSFFVHWLPVENALYAWALLTLVVTGAIVVALYALTPGLRWAGGRPRLSGRVRRHLTLFGVGVLLLLAWGHRLDAYALLSGGGSGADGAFTGADQIGALPARFALAAVTALASLVVLRAGWTGHARPAFWAVSAAVAGALLVRGLAPAVTARVADPRTLADADAAAAANRALYTQRAFGVDRLRPAPAGYGVTPAGAAAGAVSAWDEPALVRAATALRRTSVDGDVGFQPAAGGGLAAVLVEYAPGVAARPAQEGDAERTVLALDASRADELGRPVPLGGATLADAGRRVRLRVFPGAEGRLPVRAAGSDRGVRGDPLDDWRVRLAHALAGRDLRIAFASSDGAPVRVVDRRDVRARVDALAPFFAQGRAVTPVWAGDSVWFAVSLYSASASYPLAHRYGDWGTLRHAATALVNAQSGGVALVPAPELDADARAWVRRFPRLFTPASSLPGELARALPPPTDGALVQAYAFAQFGARGERRPATRHPAEADAADSALAGAGRPPLALPTPANASAPVAGPVSAWTLPVLSAADRVDGAVVTVGGPAPQTLWLPAAAGAPRWQELLDALAGAGGAELAAADRGGGPDAGSGAQERGRLRVVPLAGALAYARPEYRLGAEGAPALARVVAVAGDTVRTGPSTGAALGVDAGGAPADLPAAGGDLVARARRLYLDSRAALRRGDWAGVGRALDALGATLGAPAPAPAPPPAAAPATVLPAGSAAAAPGAPGVAGAGRAP
jgi:hypothetical protein